MNVPFWLGLAQYENQLAALDDSAVALSYQELAERSDFCVADLEPRMLVAIECTNSLDCLVAYLGCLRRRVVPLMVDAGLAASLRQQLYDLYRVHAVWAGPESGTDSISESGTSPSNWRRLQVSSTALHADLAVLLSTSGSTGSAQMVRLSYENLQANAESIAQFLGLTASERPICSLPMSYSYGLSVIHSHLSVGARLLLTQKTIVQRDFWDFLRANQGTSLAGVPATYEQLIRMRFATMTLPSLRTMTQAGGRLAPELVTQMATLALAHRRQFVVMYGQTEATARIAFLDSGRVLDKPDSIGRAIPQGELSLRDEAGDEILESKQIGQLYYRGPNVMLGYAAGPDDLIRGDDLHGVLATGDLGFRDEDGDYYITGRLKRFIKVHGNRIGLADVESALLSVGWTACAMGRDNELCIAVIGAAEEQLSEIKSWVCQQFKIQRQVVRVCGCDSFLQTTSGKTNYGGMLEEWKFD